MTAIDDRIRAVEADRAARNEDFFTDLLPEAAELVVTSGLGSTAMLQRKMRLPHAVVSDLMVELHELGVVGPDAGDQPREVLVTADALPDVLARIAALAEGEDDKEAPPPVVVDQPAQDDDPPRVSLVKASLDADLHDEDDSDWWDEDDEPGTALVPRLFGRLVPRHPGEVEPWRGGEPVTLVTRVRQAAARGGVWVADQTPVARSRAVARQAPMAGVKLVAWTPRGAKRAVMGMRAWLTDAESLRLLAKHEAAGEGESYTKVAGARAQRLAMRAWLAGAAAGVALLAGLAWWAPSVFAGMLATLVGIGVVAAGRSVCRNPQELGYLTLAALALAGLAWWQGPALAVLVPRPPGWVWWVALGVAVVVCGLLGRKEDQHLMALPARMASTEPDAPTAPMIVEALFRIGVPGMTQVAGDKGMRDEVRIIAPGVAKSTHGYTIELELPPGVTAEMVVARRGPLAGALRRDLGCVWPSGNEERHPGYLRIFLSHKPMNKAKQPAWPLAAGHPVDIFEPMPLFTDEEMRWVSLTLAGTPHLAVGGASGFGKSVWLRQLSCGVAFDLRVRIGVIDGKRSGDLDHVKKLAHFFHEGADPEDVAAVVAELRELVQEYLRRSKFLSKLPPEDRSPKVTSELASKYPDKLSPIVLFYDEVQEGTQYGVKTDKEDKAIRDEITGLLTRLSRVGRSAGIYLVLASQRPEADVIPSSIMGNCSIRVAFKVSDQVHNDQILGTSARKNGVDATMFGSRDKGMAWLKGGDDVDAQVVRSWSAMVDVSVADELAEKAYRLRKAAGLLTGQAVDDGIEDAEVVYDLAQDVEQVIRSHGRDSAQWEELLPWVREMRGQYAALTKEQLSAGIRSARVRVRDVRSGGATRKGVYVADLRKRDRAQIS